MKATIDKLISWGYATVYYLPVGAFALLSVRVAYKLTSMYQGKNVLFTVASWILICGVLISSVTGFPLFKSAMTMNENEKNKIIKLCLHAGLLLVLLGVLLAIKSIR